MNVPAPPLKSRTAKRMAETLAVTSALKSQKLDYDSSPIVNNNIVDSSKSSSSAQVQLSLSSSLLNSSSTSMDSRSFDGYNYNITYDLGDDAVILEEEICSPHTKSTAYCGSSKNSVVSSTSSTTSVAIITNTTDSNSSSTTTSRSTVLLLAKRLSKTTTLS